MSVFVKTIQSLPAASRNATTYGAGMSFDFSALIDPGEQIVCFAVGLSYLRVTYATNSMRDDEPVGQLQVILVPSQANGVIHVDASLILTDYDGDGAGESQDKAGLSTFLGVTVIVYVDGLPRGALPPILAGNQWAVGSTNIVVPVAAYASGAAFLSGFNLALTNAADDIQGLYVEADGSIAGTKLSLSGTAKFGNPPNPASADVQTIDIGYLVAEPSYANQFALAMPKVTGSGDTGSGGYTATLSAQVSLSPGQWVSGVAILLQTISLMMDDDERLEFAAAGATSLATVSTSSDGTSASVSAPMVMNLYGGDDISSAMLQCLVVATLGGGTDNLLVNSSFETGTLAPGWTATGDTDLAGVETELPHTGWYDAYLHPTATSGTGIQQVVQVTEEGTYALQAYAATSMTGGVTLQLSTASGAVATANVVGRQYTRYQLSVVAKAGDTLTVQFQSEAGTSNEGSAWATVDDVTLYYQA